MTETILLVRCPPSAHSDRSRAPNKSPRHATEGGKDAPARRSRASMPKQATSITMSPDGTRTHERKSLGAEETAA